MNLRDLILPLIAIVCIIILFFISSIPQDQSYHLFADRRTFLGVPNFLNVVSNFPFAIISLLGFRSIRNSKEYWLYHIFFILFMGFLLLTLGSGYYHLWPNNETLVYDRIPIVIIIMSFFSFIIYDRIDVRKGYVAFILLNIIGVLSVIYWILTECTGNGDLRWYMMVQFFPIIAIPLILLLYKSSFNHSKEVIPIFIFFGLAKIAEMFDAEIYYLLENIISGHSIKHLFMAAAGYYIVLLFRRRINFKNT